MRGLVPFAVILALWVSGCSTAPHEFSSGGPESFISLRATITGLDELHAESAVVRMTIHAYQSFGEVRAGVAAFPADTLRSELSYLGAIDEGESVTIEGRLRASGPGPWLVRAWAEGWADTVDADTDGFDDSRYTPNAIFVLDTDGVTGRIERDVTQVPHLWPRFEMAIDGPKEVRVGEEFTVSVETNATQPLNVSWPSQDAMLAMAWSNPLVLHSGADMQTVTLQPGRPTRTDFVFSVSEWAERQDVGVLATLYPHPGVQTYGASDSFGIHVRSQ